MINPTLLVTRPRHDPTTNYFHSWSKKIIKEARKKMQVIDLEKKNANREKVVSYLKKGIPSIVFLNGHGNKNVICGHENEELLTTKDNLKELFSDKIFFVRACQCGLVLGKKALQLGAKAFIGYKGDFGFFHQSNIESSYFKNPTDDKTAAPFMECSNKIMSALIKGHSPEEAQAQSMKLYKKKINEMLVSGKDPDTLYVLFWNMKNQVCLTNPT